MTPLKNLKNWRVVQANTLWWLSLAREGGRGSFKHLDNIIYSRVLKRHTGDFRRVLGRAEYFKKGKSRAKEGSVVISEQQYIPIKI